MLIEILMAMFVGLLVGTLTGLIPGIHINLVGVFLLSLSTSLFLSVNPIHMGVFIVSVAITHTFVDFIPSVFLGCPDTDTELSVLPGHQLLKSGQGQEAIALTAYGSLAAVFILIMIAFPTIFIISKTYDLVLTAMPFLLISASILLIFLEKKKSVALFVFLFTGFLGWSVLGLDQLKEPLLPLLSGLFGASMLIMSIKTKTIIPKQKITKTKIKSLKPLLGALIASPLCSFLPGLGSGQAAILGNSISKTDRKGFLFLLGATNTLVMGFSFISLYAISRTRTGAAVVLQKILGTFSWKILLLILIVFFVVGIFSFFLTLALAKTFSTKMNKINYSLASFITLIVLTAIVFLVSGIFGVAVLIVSMLTGIYCVSLGVRRTNMMGCLLLPTIIFYLL